MRGIRPRAGVLFVQRCSTLLFLIGVPQAAPVMRGVRPRAAGSFSDARKGTKSAHKGSTPYVSPGRVPAFGWAEGTRMSQPAPTCFLSRQTTPTRPGLYRKTPLHSARPGWACQLAGESAPRWGSFCAAAQHLTFFEMCAAGGRECPVPSGRTACFLLVQKAR